MSFRRTSRTSGLFSISVNRLLNADGSVTLNNRGMAPNVTMVAYGFEYDGSGTFLYTNPGDIQTDYFNAFVNLGANLCYVNSLLLKRELRTLPGLYQRRPRPAR